MLKRLWDKAIYTGLTDELDPMVKAKAVLLNQLGVISIIGLVIITIARFYTSPITTIESIVSMLIVALVTGLNYRQYFKMSRHIATFMYPLALAVIICKGGGNMGEFPIYFLCLIMSYIMHEGEIVSRTLSTLWVILLFVVSYLYITMNFIPNTIATNIPGTIVTFLVSVFITHYLVLFYQKEINAQKIQKDQLLSTITEKNIELERFAYIASHDLKEPLKNIMSFSALSAKYIKEKKLDRAPEFLNIIQNNAQHMHELIQDTLELVSYDRNNHPPAQVDLNVVIENVEAMLSESLAKKNTILQVNQKLPVISGYKNEVLSCFKNLIENGMRYNQSTQPKIEIDFKQIEGKYIFSVSDNGIGIAPENHEKIFDMYNRLVNRKQYTGTGLGLAICKKIIEKLGGNIWVNSQEGKGSTFSFSIPVAVPVIA